MKRILIFILVAYLFPVPMMAQKTMKEYTILNGRVRMELPVGFHPKSPEKDDAAEWTDSKDSTLLLYHLSNDSITDNDIPALIDDQIKLAKQDDHSFQYLDDGIYLQDGKNIGYLKFSSEEFGKKYFNYIFFISVENRLMAVTFVCSWGQHKKWEPVVDSIANSLRINLK